MRRPPEEAVPDDISLAKLTMECTLSIVTGDEDPDGDPACGACGERELGATHQQDMNEAPEAPTKRHIPD